MRSTLIALLPSLAVLASCVQQKVSPNTAPTPAAVAEPKAPSVPKVADLCVARSATVCALLEDGRVSCAQIHGDRVFEPPLAGITKAVELACGEHSICARDGAGSITCIDEFGELHLLDSLAQSRSLAPDCAVAQDGAAFCWDENMEVSYRDIPDGYRDKLRDLQRLILATHHGFRGCALKRDGELWCWDSHHSPKLVAKIDRPEDIRELKLLDDEKNGVCWRGAGEWLCTDGQSEVMLHEPCVVDRLGRVLCQLGKHPPDEFSLPLTDETSARYEPLVPPPPDLQPLPDPGLSDCPKEVVVSNRVCEHFSAPGGRLECSKGEVHCPRNCSVNSASHDDCEPDGFVVVDSSAGGDGRMRHVVHADGAQVWLGPRLAMDPLDAVPGADKTAPTLIELHEQIEDGHTYYETQHELTAVMICGLAEGRPVCSLPIARDWRLESVEWDDEDSGKEIDRESIHYRADMTVTSTDVKITVRAGKRHANSSNTYVGHVRVLPAGTHALASLLDQRFVDLPE
jgi:hypothetical protein